MMEAKVIHSPQVNTQNEKEIMAIKLASLGLKVFPLRPNGKEPVTKNGYKDATNDLEQVQEWWTKNPNYNIGLPAGLNDLFIIDIDVKGKVNGHETLKKKGFVFPETVSQDTPSGGNHLLFKMNGLKIKNKVREDLGIDIRGDGGYIVISPSTINGNRYRLKDLEGGTTDPTTLIKEVVSIAPNGKLSPIFQDFFDLMDKKNEDHRQKFKLPDVISEGGRNETLFQYACSLQARGYDDEEITDKVVKANISNCEIPLEDEELFKIIESALKYEKGTNNKLIGDIGRFHNFNLQGKATSVQQVAVANDILANNHIMTIGKEAYIYKNGVYSRNLPDPESELPLTSGHYILKEIEKRTIDRLMNIDKYNQIERLILKQTEISDDMVDKAVNRYPDHFINFRNGMYDLKTGIMREHDPSFFSINQIPHDLQYKNIDTIVLNDIPVFSTFLKNTLKSDDNIRMFLQYLGYSLTTKSIQQLLYIVGNGGVGKSLILRLISKIIGTQNVSEVSIQKLAERFMGSQLFGKTLNIHPDLTSSALKQGDYLKSIWGGDRIMAEKKNKDAFYFTPYVKGIFVMNRIPLYIDEKSEAYYRRLLILRIPITKNEVFYIHDVENKLAKEIPLILQLAIKSLKEIALDNGEVLPTWNISPSGESGNEVKQLQIGTDPIESFLVECTETLPKEEWKPANDFSRTACYQYYRAYCDATGRKALSSGRFYEELREKGFSVSDNGTRPIRGLRLIPFDGIEMQWGKYQNGFHDDVIKQLNS